MHDPVLPYTLLGRHGPEETVVPPLATRFR